MTANLINEDAFEAVFHKPINMHQKPDPEPCTCDEDAARTCGVAEMETVDGIRREGDA